MSAGEYRSNTKMVQKLAKIIQEQELNFTRLKRFFVAGDLEAMAELLDL